MKKQNMPVNKKGISPVVATVSIVMITLAAAGFIAGIIVPLVKNRLNEGTECLGYEQYFSFYEGFEYNCYVNASYHLYYAFSVQASSVSDDKLSKIKGLRVQFLGDGESKGIDVVDGQTPDLQGLSMLNESSPMRVPAQGDVRTYVYNSSMRYDWIELYLVLKSGRVCEKSDSLRVSGSVCNPSVNLG